MVNKGNRKALHCEAKLCDVVEFYKILKRDGRNGWPQHCNKMLDDLEDRIDATGDRAVMDFERKNAYDAKAIILKHHGSPVVTSAYDCEAEISALRRQIATGSVPDKRLLLRRSRIRRVS